MYAFVPVVERLVIADPGYPRRSVSDGAVAAGPAICSCPTKPEDALRVLAHDSLDEMS